MNKLLSGALITGCLVATLAVPAQAAVYVADAGPRIGRPAILVFASDALGDQAPLRIIAGGNTGLENPVGVTVDEMHHELFVSNFNSPTGVGILVFPLHANGNVSPSRTITDGPNSQLGWPRQVVVDTVNDEIVVASFTLQGPPTPDSSIRTYSRTASGDAAPVRSIFGPNTRLDNPVDLALDTVHDELITNSYSADNRGTPGLLIFSRTASGNVAPLRAIVGPATRLSSYTNELAYDPEEDEIYADTDRGMSYGVFPRAATGNVAPVRRVSALAVVRGLTYDGVNRRVIVSDFDEHDPDSLVSLRAFPRDATGNVPPVVTVAGSATTFDSPTGLATDASGGFSAIGAQVYTDAASFDAAAGDPAAFSWERFDNGATGAGELNLCADPVSIESNDECFAPGQVVGGLTVTSNSAVGVAVMGNGFFGNGSAVLGAILTADTTIVTMTPQRTALAMDVYLYSGESRGAITVTLLDASGISLGQARVTTSALGRAAFLGVVSPRPIARVDLQAATGTAMIDNVRFRE